MLPEIDNACNSTHSVIPEGYAIYPLAVPRRVAAAQSLHARNGTWAASMPCYNFRAFKGHFIIMHVSCSFGPSVRYVLSLEAADTVSIPLTVEGLR